MRQATSVRTSPTAGAPRRLAPTAAPLAGARALAPPSRAGAGRLAAALFAAALGLLASGCAPPARGPAAPPGPGVVESVRALGLGLDDPLALDARIVADLEATVGRAESPLQRFRHVVRYVTSRQSLHFQYSPFETFSAERAFYERRGDCLSFANLVNALARRVGLDTYFVYINDVPHHYEHGGWFFTSSHVAVGYSEGATNYVSDFPREPDEWTVLLFRRIADDDAAALYYNSIAADRLVAGQIEPAERILGHLVDRRVNAAEIYNNYGLVLNRRGQHAEANSVFDHAAARFPGYAPIYNNGASLAIAAGQPELATRWLERFDQAARADPFAHFVRGLEHYRARRFDRATDEFSAAAKAYDRSATSLAWLVRSQAEGGRRAEAAQSFRRLRALVPRSKLTRQLREHYPFLEAGGG
ncbi:MAG TPA: transglutaminase domain-containing protein [Polyangiaceae bacterium]|nr:transglutaminase domain-containing protein [Polyangiaceae bacterium]